MVKRRVIEQAEVIRTILSRSNYKEYGMDFTDVVTKVIIEYEPFSWLEHYKGEIKNYELNIELLKLKN